jgi:hypothetical protein
MLTLDDLREMRDLVEPVFRDDISPSSPGTSSWRGYRGSPDGSVAERELVYVQPGCSSGSLRLCVRVKSTSVVTVMAVLCGFAVRSVDGRSIFGFILFAFFRPDDHHNSRSVEPEFVELMDVREVLMEFDLMDRSLVFRSLRAPTDSASLSSGKSVANMFDYSGESSGVQRGHYKSMIQGVGTNDRLEAIKHSRLVVPLNGKVVKHLGGSCRNPKASYATDPGFRGIETLSHHSDRGVIELFRTTIRTSLIRTHALALLCCAMIHRAKSLSAPCTLGSSTILLEREIRLHVV